MIITSRFRAMGTTIELILDADNDPAAHTALMQGRNTLLDVEAALSRFDPTSELSRLNREGFIAPASDVLFDALSLALDARADTGGRFDPSVGAAVVAAGYDRSFDELPAMVQGRAACPSAQGTPAVLDESDHSIRLAPGVQIDLGGIAKGLAAELVAEQLSSVGPCLVSAGGDIAVRGVPASGDWPVSITTADTDWVVGMTGGGLATSGRDRRKWTTTTGAAHHVVDPRTGAPAVTDVMRISVFAPTAVDAETLATALMIVGSRAAIAEADQRGYEAIVVTEDGRTLATGGLS
jgi:thiamine biosynthesis lipoprotein